MTDQLHKPRGVGLFDLRWILALLFAVYGVVLTVMGAAFTSQADLDRAAGTNVNLWVGIGMLIGAAAFATWSLLRPIRLRPAAPPGPGPGRD
ncbi:drug/metabolite transporter (DMT)-like permease [Kitasatospora sp. MAA4]|uniref:hypothetical protein n=1 Tax=Kitasatospora sp. MAA4 TaxID=3035093 RepID=UPI002475EAC9|nr:hypothetical protein [Kitasatospora sp. MAA4]MDH6137556.1 drug/metabolite transporter (DMT)-like permease [Kitasatospora sp. MAA4]